MSWWMQQKLSFFYGDITSIMEKETEHTRGQTNIKLWIALRFYRKCNNYDIIIENKKWQSGHRRPRKKVIIKSLYQALILWGIEVLWVL